MVASDVRGDMTQADTIGAALPDYEVSRELGRGAMGVVYLGRHRRLERDVAIKELSGPLADDADVRSRFLVEARTLAVLDHPHVVPVYDYVEDGGRCLLIMEALPGGTIWDEFSSSGLGIQRACALALATCSALHHAHGHGILHRDIKPENLLFSGTGELKVTDFGIAKVLDGGRTLATMDGSVLGTPAYMAPEQAEGAEVGPSADVYAVATMVYEFASGRLPFDGDSPMALLVQRITTDPPPLTEVAPAVPAAIAEVVMTALARSPEARPASAEAFGCALGEAATEAWGEDWLEQAGVPLAGSLAILAAAAPARTLPPVGTRQQSDRSDEPVEVDRASGPATIAPARTPPGAATVAPSGSPTPAAQEPAPTDSTLPPSEAASPAPAPAPAPRLAPQPASAPTMRPVGGRHQPGFDPAALHRDQLVGIEEVVGKEVPILSWLVVTVAALVAAVVLTLTGPGPLAAPAPPSEAGAVAAPTLAGAAEPKKGSTRQLDLAEPVAVIAPGAPPGASATIALHLADVPVGSHTAPVTNGRATVNMGPTGWLVDGPAVATVSIESPAGNPVVTATYAVGNSREPWRSAQVPVLVLLALFGLGSAEAQSRRHRRGRVRSGAVVGAAVAGALAGTAASLLWSVRVGDPVGLPSVVAVAVASAVAAGAATVLRARRARRRRLLLRAGR